MSRAGDQSFPGIGIPSMFMGMGEQPLGGENPMAAVMGGGDRKSTGFGWWWHTPDDTLDKIDSELLVRDARIYLHAIWRLLTDRIVPLDCERQAEALALALAGLAENIGDGIGMKRVLDRVQILGDRAATVKAGAEDDAVAINRALGCATRALVSIDYTSGNRFDQHPALGQHAYRCWTRSASSRRRSRKPTRRDTPRWRRSGR